MLFSVIYRKFEDTMTIVGFTRTQYSRRPFRFVRSIGILLSLQTDRSTLIVTVEGTPMDFRTPTPVGKRINDFDFVQLKNGNGYDHNWVIQE